MFAINTTPTVPTPFQRATLILRKSGRNYDVIGPAKDVNGNDIPEKVYAVVFGKRGDVIRQASAIATQAGATLRIDDCKNGKLKSRWKARR